MTMDYSKYIALLVLSVLPYCAQAQSAGKYIGTVQTEWLEDGRRMRLLASFSYIDPKGLQWDAPSGWVVDGASIPQVAWTFIGGPFEGKYRNASVIHDVGCDQKARPWESVHEVFYWAMLTSEVETWRAMIMYAAVYHFGPRWPRKVTVRDLPVTEAPVAREKALAEADPGSTAEIINIHARGRTLNEILTNQPEKGDFEVQVSPPPPSLTQADFENLKEAIENSEPTASGAFSLEEIRRYRPER